MDSPYLSVGKVAKLLDMSTKWIYLNQDKIPGRFKIGGSIFFDRRILEEALKNLASKPTVKRPVSRTDKHGVA